MSCPTKHLQENQVAPNLLTYANDLKDTSVFSSSFFLFFGQSVGHNVVHYQLLPLSQSVLGELDMLQFLAFSLAKFIWAVRIGEKCPTAPIV